MKRAMLVLLLAATAGSLVVDRRERVRRHAVQEAFQSSGLGTARVGLAEAARLSPFADFGAEIFAAAALRDWLDRNRSSALYPSVRATVEKRPPWAYPHPWPWPDSDYASEYLAAIAELESSDIPHRETEENLLRARRLMVDAVRARPGWPQHRRTLDALTTVLQ